MKKWILAFLALLTSLPALAAPKVQGNTGEASTYSAGYEVNIFFPQGDTADSEAIYVRNACKVRVTIAGSDTVQVWAVPLPTTVASSGTSLFGTIGASTTTVPFSFEAGTYYVKVKGATASTGGSTMKINCANTPSLPVAAGSSAMCALGIKGGGYNPLLNWYEWACGNYPWSAEIGGINASTYVSVYNSPTTPGGNSWVMNCTGLRTASNGTAAEQTGCTQAGEKIKMYSTADLVLAQDMVRPGGAVYMAQGNYHFGYCGQNQSQVANGCPVTREDPGIMTRKFSATRNRKVIGAGADWDGPFVNGRSGSFFIVDMGTDNDLDLDWTDDTPAFANITQGGVGSTFSGTHWSMHAGYKMRRKVCGWTATSGGCVANASISNQTGVAESGMSPINAGYNGGANTILADATKFNFAGSEYVEVCVNDTIGVTGNGVCSGNQAVLCDNNAASGRFNANGGDCAGIGLGTCEGIYSAFKRANNALPAGDHGTILFDVKGIGVYGGVSGNSSTSQAFYAPIADDGFTDTSCATGAGKIIRLGGPFTSEQKYGFSNFPAYLISAQYTTAYYVPESVLMQPESGFQDISIMPQDYYGSATCPAGATTGCDETELIGLSGGFNTFVRRAAIWFGGGSGAPNHYGFSVVDGDPACQNCELGWSLISNFIGLGSDASGWWYHDNTWEVNSGSPGGGSVLATDFGPDARLERDVFRNFYGDNLIFCQNSTGLNINDVKIESNEMAVAFFRLRNCQNVKIDGITGQANSGILLSAEGNSTLGTPANITVNGVRLKNHSWSSANGAKSFFLRTNYGFSSFDSAYKGIFNLTNSAFQVHGDNNACLFFWDGYEGDDSVASHGQGFAVDDDRDVFNFENVDLEVYDDGSKAGTQLAFCFGEHNQALANEPGDANLKLIHQIVGPIPKWTNISINSTNIPDNPFGSIRSEDAGDCGTLLSGTVVRVYDADVAGTCEDDGGSGTLNDGIMDPEAVDGVGLTSLCKCDPAGNAGTGKWNTF